MDDDEGDGLDYLEEIVSIINECGVAIPCVIGTEDDPELGSIMDSDWLLGPVPARLLDSGDRDSFRQ